jgi:hypothetical protein
MMYARPFVRAAGTLRSRIPKNEYPQLDRAAVADGLTGIGPVSLSFGLLSFSGIGSVSSTFPYVPYQIRGSSGDQNRDRI